MSAMPESWLAETWAKEFAAVLQMVTNREFSVACATGPLPLIEQPVWWTQPLNISPDHPLLIGTSLRACLDLGRSCLQAAGIEDVDEQAARSTYLEVLQQSLIAFARSVGKKLARVVDCQPGSEATQGAAASAACIMLSMGSDEIEPIYFCAAPTLGRLLTQDPEHGASNGRSVSTDATTGAEFANPIPSTAPKSVELLMDVEMPVVISFGSAQLPLRDVLKFTAGSVVELNRHPDDPVEIVVNNCVIARGEVVVIDGNYGVRVHEIVSRQQRLAIRNFERAFSRTR